MKARKITSLILAALLMLSLIPMATVSASAAELPKETVGGVTYYTVTLYDPDEPVVGTGGFKDYKDGVGTEIAASGEQAKDAEGILIDLKATARVEFKIKLDTHRPSTYGADGVTNGFYYGKDGYASGTSETDGWFIIETTDWEGTVFIPAENINNWDVTGFDLISINLSGGTWDNVRLAYLDCDHEWEVEEVLEEPTYLAPGSQRVSCDKCGKEKIEVLEMLHCDHEWEDGDFVKEPTHIEDGEQTISCDKCGTVTTKTVDKLAEHDTDGRWLRVDDNQHKLTCGCGEEIFENHTWDEGSVWKEPTHTKKGVLRKGCIANGCVASIDEDIPMLTEHEWSYESLDANQHKATCACGEEQTEDHTWDAGVVTTEPTVDAEGVKTFTCACGATRTEAIAKLPAEEGESEEDGGCGSVVGGGFAMMAILSGAAVVLTKKKRK